MEYGRPPGQLLASVALIVKLNTPFVVGVPEMIPVRESSVRPLGSAPAETVKVYGAIPPVADTVWLYGVPRTPGGNVVGLTVITGQLGMPATTMEYGRLPGQPFASVAVIVKLKVPAAVSVPEIKPVVGLSTRPVGRAPLETVKVYGAVPPTPETVWL
jgi:hypothetical protein